MAERPPALVISLDFELHWGVSEHVDLEGHPYLDTLRRTRDVVIQLLEIFRDRQVHATWAVVGALMTGGRNELIACRPTREPGYTNTRLSNHRVTLGGSEADDPMHFAPTLVERIRRTPGQEVATHTFLHFYCTEDGQTKEDFISDLSAAAEIGRAKGCPPKSIVFPRNQIADQYLEELPRHGVEAFRGQGQSWLDRRIDSPWLHQLRRGVRLLDSYANLSGAGTVPWRVVEDGPPHNVPASRFLRPVPGHQIWKYRMRNRRVLNGMRTAARRSEIFHLWWHPHNMGDRPEVSLPELERLLDGFDQLRRQYGMESLTMWEAVQHARRTA